MSEKEILYQSPQNDFQIIDEEEKGFSVKITTANGRLSLGYASSADMNSIEISLYKATKIPLQKLLKMPIEQVKDMLRKRNQKIRK